RGQPGQDSRPMPTLSAIATALPEHCLAQEDIQSFAQRMFAGRLPEVKRLLPVFRNAGIETRYFCTPLDWFERDHSLAERSDLYVRAATDLGANAARQVCEKNGVALDDIDCIFYINTTGLATPSIDARLINRLELRPDIRRTPIWGLGCAGGVAGLTRACDYLRGHPAQRALVVAVELCGLTFIRSDPSKSNFVACALFGDGAAAALLCGDEVAATGPNIVGMRSTFYPDSLEIMGWNIVTEGLQVVFNERIPELVAEKAGPELRRFLSDHGLSQSDISDYLYHPGGKKVLAAYQSAYGVNGDAFRHSVDVLRDYGNMSSVTVLFVLDHFMKRLERPDRETRGHAVVSALGPGFSSESMLLAY
ncbi:MAG TPA: 3-oxoacyl-[acyl-carrier-protein] synthase III C-terminal domain-containing protein, partial [candidate division Zixibacteria bacterium]|nr:3-oxoacyl-[acyl-carrier-protein] synthase III C-terminal domain-containing protein [candidate division Zixibacteria bacterium]